MVLEGEFKNNQKNGKWEYLDSHGNKTHEEIYKNGNFKKGSFFSVRGVTPMNKKRDIFLKPNEAIKSFDIDKDHLPNLFTYFSTIQNNAFDSLTVGIRYPGGSKNLQNSIYTRVKYPVAAFRNRIKGTVIVLITIDEEGNVKKYDILKSVHKSLDTEAIRVLELFRDKWFPALHNGKPYESKISIPITWS